MAYSTKADIILELSEVTLGELTNDTTGGTANDAVVTRCIENADTEIDSYIRGKNTVGGTDVILRKRSVDIAIYYLYARRQRDNLPDTIIAGYEAAMTWLRAIRDNKVLIDDATSVANTASYVKVSKTSSDKVFTNTKLSQYR